MTTNIDNTTTASPTLLTLPRELRDAILLHVLLKPDNIITILPDFPSTSATSTAFSTANSSSPSTPHDLSARPPAICIVNRQLRAETLPVYYSRNRFTAQLDNADDLATARRWLAVAALDDGSNGPDSGRGRSGGDHGRDLVRSARWLRYLDLRGWTRVPFGHMWAKRWLEVRLDLRAGTMEVEKREPGRSRARPGREQEPEQEPEQHPQVLRLLEDMRRSFEEAVQRREGGAFDVVALWDLMAGFNLLCTGY